MSITASAPKRNHAAATHLGRVKTACTITTTSSTSMIGYDAAKIRSSVAPSPVVTTGVTTHCQMTADAASATMALSTVVSRRKCLRASRYNAMATHGYATRSVALAHG